MVNGDDSDDILFVKSLAGEEMEFDAGGSVDPDKNKLHYKWWIYQEAGTYAGQIRLNEAQNPKVKFTVPTGAAGKQIHLILEVKDEGVGAPLFDFRRVVIDVENRVISLPPFQK